MVLFLTGDTREQSWSLTNFIASFVPHVLNQTNGNEALREVRTLADNVMARTGLYNRVDPRRNVLGEAILRHLPKYDPLGLTVENVREPDLVMAEITRLVVIQIDFPEARLALKFEGAELMGAVWVVLFGEGVKGLRDLDHA